MAERQQLRQRLRQHSTPVSPWGHGLLQPGQSSTQHRCRGEAALHPRLRTPLHKQQAHRCPPEAPAAAKLHWSGKSAHFPRPPKSLHPPSPLQHAAQVGTGALQVHAIRCCPCPKSAKMRSRRTKMPQVPGQPCCLSPKCCAQNSPIHLGPAAAVAADPQECLSRHQTSRQQPLACGQRPR